MKSFSLFLNRLQPALALLMATGMFGCTSIDYPLFRLDYDSSVRPAWEEIDLEYYSERYPDAAGVYLHRIFIADNRLMRWANGMGLKGIRLSQSRHLVLDPLDDAAAPFSFGVRKGEELVRAYVAVHYPDGTSLYFDREDLEQVTRLKDELVRYYLESPELKRGCIVDIGVEIHEEKLNRGVMYIPVLQQEMPTEYLRVRSYLSNKYTFTNLDALEDDFPGGVEQLYDAERKRHVMQYIASDVPAREK